MPLADADIREIAKFVAVSPEACRRLLGNLQISISGPGKVAESAPAGSGYNLGLRLAPGQTKGRASSSDLIHILGRLLVEYRNTCPHIVNWICRGDFNPRKIPENVGLAQVKHATRTAGRLRAELMRSIQ